MKNQTMTSHWCSCNKFDIHEDEIKEHSIDNVDNILGPLNDSNGGLHGGWW